MKEVIDEKELKEKAREAAEALNEVFENTHITGIRRNGDDILFYEGDELAFTYTVKEVMEGIGNVPPLPWHHESIIKNASAFLPRRARCEAPCAFIS